MQRPDYIQGVLIKPVSGSCNMRCNYCFYEDEMKKREQYNYGKMSQKDLETIVKKLLRIAKGPISFAFQGGEPTLAGLPFYERLILFQERYNVNQVQIHNTIQTNGYLLDENWLSFLQKHHFLVGISLDGIKRTHDKFRLDGNRRPTFEKVMETIRLLHQYGIEHHILTVVTKQAAREAERIYRFYRRHDFRYLQFIPCLDPLGEEKGKQEYSLDKKEYAKFLCRIFDLWCEDYLDGKEIHIRDFDNYIGIFLEMVPEACAQRGKCSVQHVIEADGSVYPCDFYVMEKYKLGNLILQEPEELDYEAVALRFLQEGDFTPDQCRQCRYYALCRNGCRRNRENEERLNEYCESYQAFFSHAGERMGRIAADLASRFPEACR